MRQLVLICAALLLSGCIRTRYSAMEGRTPVRPPDTFRYFDAPKAKLAPEAPESERFSTSTLTFDAHNRKDEANLVVSAKLRVPKEGPKKGLVIVLPILGGDYGPSDLFARYLSERGFVTMRFDRKAKLFDPEGDFADVAGRIRDGVVDVRRGIDIAQRLGHARGGVGLLGISMGSFPGTIISGIDPRIRASVLALGGGGLVDVVYSARSEEEVSKFFAALKSRGMSDAAIRKNAHEHLDALDPVSFAGGMNRHTTLLIHAKFDAVVPYDNGSKLWRAAGQPPRITLLTGHYSAVITLPFLQAATAEHFARYLRGP